MNAIKFKMKKSDEKDYVIVNDDGKGQEGIGRNCATLHCASRFVQFLIFLNQPIILHLHIVIVLVRNEQ